MECIIRPASTSKRVYSLEFSVATAVTLSEQAIVQTIRSV